MDQERRITPSEALNHPFVTMAHMADYAHCANVKSSAQKMEICKRSPGVVGVVNPTATTPSAAVAAAAAPTTLMAAGGLRSGNVTLTFNNQLGGRVGAAAAQVVNGLAVRERTAAYDAHYQVRRIFLLGHKGCDYRTGRYRTWSENLGVAYERLISFCLSMSRGM